VVVDNASTDGYAELFTALADSGLCEVIANREQRYHGPALTQAMDHMSATQSGDRRVGPCWSGRRRLDRAMKRLTSCGE
jgi:hypothetical protein